MSRVFLVGAGPGDPELLTLKAARILAQADVVLHDSLVDPRIIALVNSNSKIIDVGKRCGRHSATQETICSLLVAESAAGHLVVRLKGGDPMIFGRATEEMEALRAQNIAFEIVPGITAACAAAADIKISLTQRNVSRSLHIITGHGADGGLPNHDFCALTKSGGTLAIYMGGETLPGLAAHFIESGMEPSMPALLIENASLPTERQLLATIASLPSLHVIQPVTGPVLILVGDALRYTNGRAAVTSYTAHMAAF